MQARIGDLAIARFESDDQKQKYEEHICVVIGRYNGVACGDMKFVYWRKHGRSTTAFTSSLPKNRLVRIRIRPTLARKWCGDIASLKLSEVELV